MEGRTKSLYYVARTAQVYRRAIDDALAGRPFNPELLADLDSLASRGYTDGFYQRHHTHEYQNYLKGHSEAHRSQYVGDIIGRDPATGWAIVAVKNRFQVGDRLEFIQPEGNQTIELAAMTTTDGLPLQIASGVGYTVHLPLPGHASSGLLARFL